MLDLIGCLPSDVGVMLRHTKAKTTRETPAERLLREAPVRFFLVGETPEILSGWISCLQKMKTETRFFFKRTPWWDGGTRCFTEKTYVSLPCNENPFPMQAATMISDGERVSVP